MEETASVAIDADTTTSDGARAAAGSRTTAWYAHPDCAGHVTVQ